MNEKTIINYLQGHATEEEMALVGAWISESEENARRFFEMEEVHNTPREQPPAQTVKAARSTSISCLGNGRELHPKTVASGATMAGSRQPPCAASDTHTD